MLNEVKAKAEVGVGIERLWNALASDLRSVVPKVVPNLVKHVEVVGDSGLGTVFLFTFGSGGHLNLGFSSYKTIFQLTSEEEEKTQVNVKVLYESETEESSIPSKTKALL
ncbi:START-like domain containing protein [Parasponia andersonii]|uniref:START-like domain containing protein n=1 Tax=Parasponia andersonii TaxID=3476 RepID=A0A2P5B716_PARAD|nr:START-like domain containing protein [Parasponia andersonii]